MHWKILCSIAESCMMEVGRQRNHEDPSQRSVSPDTALLAGTDAEKTVDSIQAGHSKNSKQIE